MPASTASRATALAICVLTLPSIAAEPGAPEEPSGQAGADELSEAWQVRREGNVEGVASQERIDALSEETDSLFTRYSNALRQTDALRDYNRQMRELIRSQEGELASLREQVDQVEVVGRSVVPLMNRMIDALEAFVDLDIPFLIEERRKRVEDLRRMMPRSDVTNSEKFRQIMEAYLIENEYGRTIEAYRGALPRGDGEITVDFLRFGRIALVYQTLDESEAGVWRRDTGDWEPLDASHRGAIREGLRIARKQIPPDLMRLPIATPEEDGSDHGA